jgi:hypothetical protein
VITTVSIRIATMARRSSGAMAAILRPANLMALFSVKAS